MASAHDQLPAARPGLVPRERLLHVLRHRHQQRLILMDAPAGFGRTTLLQQAAGEAPGPGHHDVSLAFRAGAGTSLAAAVADAADAHPSGTVSVLLDDAHHTVDAASLADLVDGLPDRVHLVVSTRLGAIPGLARAVAREGAVRLSTADLAFTPAEASALVKPWELSAAEMELATWPAVAALLAGGDHDLVIGYLQDEVLTPLDPVTVQALGALALTGGGSTTLVQGLLELVSAGAAVQEQLAAVPLVALSEGGGWPHPIWAQATADRIGPGVRQGALLLAVDDRLERRAHDEAGALAVEAADADALRAVVRASLATHPPLVGRASMQRWAGSGLLTSDDAEARWLEGVLAGQAGADEIALQRLEQARAAFEAVGDADGETRVVMHLGALARRTDDLALLTAQVGHSDRLAADGSVGAAGLGALGRAVGAALAGDAHQAVRELEHGPVASLSGDWAAQRHMVLATNLALVGREDDAVTSMTRATGIGSPASRATAEDLLASILWSTGAFPAALDASDRSVALAEQADAPLTLEMAGAMRTLLGALADEHPDDARHLAEHAQRVDMEAHALLALARVVETVQRGDVDEARRLLQGLAEPPVRPTRSKLWLVALEVALLPGAEERWAAVAAEQAYIRRSVAAGAAGAAHLRDETEVAPEHRPFLPSVWWRPQQQEVVRVRLLGGAAVDRGRSPVLAAAWNRGRVRELALHLALRRDVGRDAVAQALWPDHARTAAGRNLRVTLSHLLDVLDPDRARGEGSAALVDADGRLHLADVAWLRVDITEQARRAQEVLAAAAADDAPSALAAAHRLLQIPDGPVLGGAPAGEWLEPHRRHHEHLLFRARSCAASLALAAGDAPLALQLAAAMVQADPWSEQARQVRIAAHLAAGEIDLARQEVGDTWALLGDLGLSPQQATVELARRAGMGRSRTRSPEDGGSPGG